MNLLNSASLNWNKRPVSFTPSPRHPFTPSSSHPLTPSLFLALSLLLLLTNGCTTEPPSSADREVLQDDTVAALHQMYAQDPTLQPFLTKSAGYVVFPAVGKGALGIGGAYGRGQVYKSGQFIGFADLTQATIGLQIGGQGYSEIVAFETPDALNNFEGGRFTFAATASAVIIKAGAGAAAKYDDGVSVFVNPNGGLMLEAAIGGQSFNYLPK